MYARRARAARPNISSSSPSFFDFIYDPLEPWLVYDLLEPWLVPSAWPGRLTRERGHVNYTDT